MVFLVNRSRLVLAPEGWPAFQSNHPATQKSYNPSEFTTGFKPAPGFDGNLLALSVVYMATPIINCFSLLMQLMPSALVLARAKAGSNIAAKMAMMAITTNNSIRVNAL